MKQSKLNPESIQWIKDNPKEFTRGVNQKIRTG